MRAVWAVITLAGCSAVHLGEEYEGSDTAAATAIDAEVTPQRDVDAAVEAPVDASTLRAALSVRAGSCDAGCYELTASATGGHAPFSFDWEDGSHEAARRVCATPSAVSVTVRDADGARASTELSLLESATVCAPARPLLCLENPSFEGTPAANFGLPNNFDASPWSVCADPGVSNTPEVLSDAIQGILTTIPKATDGATFLGLVEGEQVSQRLCREVATGESLSVKVDLSRLYIGAGVVPDTELPWLEIWGGLAASCSARELLWKSTMLEIGWHPFCATLRPTMPMDFLVLRARTDNSLPSTAYLLADHLQPVSECN